MKPNIYVTVIILNFFSVHDERTGMMKVHGDNGG
jgi:hypothetical protein